MWRAIGDALPLATGLALSPLAVITGIILLLGDRGRIKAALFALGWLGAIFLIAATAFWVVDVAEDVDAEGTATGVDVVQLLLALLVFALVATAGVLVPLAVALGGGPTLTPALTAAREWPEANTSPITITVLAVLGSYFLGQGIGLVG
jgi:hypothetical protein